MYNVTKNKKKKIGGNEEEPARLRGRGKVSVSDPEKQRCLRSCPDLRSSTCSEMYLWRRSQKRLKKKKTHP